MPLSRKVPDNGRFQFTKTSGGSKSLCTVVLLVLLIRIGDWRVPVLHDPDQAAWLS